MRFDELGLKPRLLQNLAAMDYEELTPIQEQTFSIIKEGRDLMAMAETGSGKTSACGIPIVQNMDPDIQGIQALILVPTRELAQQYVEEIHWVSVEMGIACFAIFGGFPMNIQKAKLQHGVQILVATPGRLIDHLYNSDLTLASLKTLVLDEADVMLDMGFIDDIRFIQSCIVRQHQTLMFSATMPDPIARLAKTCLVDPVRIELNRDRLAPQSLVHVFRYLDAHARQQGLQELLQNEELRQAIIFCNSRESGERLFRSLRGGPSGLEYIHGGLPQERRTSIFNNFKKGRLRVLIATDVAGRGLDFSQVTHVINYDFPPSTEAYTHRTGRAGRMGRKGTACTLVTRRDLGRLDTLLRTNRIQVVWDGSPPSEKAEHGGERHHAHPRPQRRSHGREHRGPRGP